MAVSTTPQSSDELLARSLADELDALSFGRTTTLNRACAHLLSTHGKQLRGRLLLAAARQGPRPHAPPVGQAACAIELLHLASLAHDDVIDAGTVRRGVPTAGVRFGQQASGFAGGWLFARAVELIAESGPAPLDLFAKTARLMCEGGMLEFRDLYNTRRTAQSYFAAAEQKTASAFFLAGELGAGLAGASAEIASAAGRFGLEFGMAYQIWDDLMDLLASPEQSGKTPESDLRQGVFTLPVIYALEESDELRKRLAADGAHDDAPDEVIAHIMRTAAIERATDAAEKHAERARKALGELPDPTDLSSLLERARQHHLGAPR